MPNLFLSSLVEADQGLLAPHLELITLGVEENAAPNLLPKSRRGRGVLFPTRGFGFPLGCKGGRSVGLGVVGREGVVGAWTAFGHMGVTVGTGLEIRFAFDGDGMWIPLDVFRTAYAESASFREALMQYLRGVTAQMAWMMFVNANFALDERLARWLLLIQDRSEQDEFQITHAFLAQLLAVRRPGVTVAMGAFEDEGLIQSERGRVAIRDRLGLKRRANGAYSNHEREARLDSPVV